MPLYSHMLILVFDDFDAILEQFGEFFVERTSMRKSRCFTPRRRHSKRHTPAVAARDFNICLGLSGLIVNSQYRLIALHDP